MDVCLPVLIVVEKSSHVHVGGTFNVFFRDTFGLPDNKSDLKFFLWLRIDINNRSFMLFIITYFNPHFERSTWKVRILLMQGSKFNRFVLNSFPLSTVISCIEIYRCLSNKVISKEIIIIIRVNLQIWCSWQLNLEFIAFVEFRMWLVQLIIFSFTDFLLTTFNKEVWIWFWQ